MNALARAIDPRYRALVLLAGFGGLRLGELLAPKANDFDPECGIVRVEKQAVELRDGTRIVTAPKTEAIRRVVHLPAAVSGALSCPGTWRTSRRRTTNQQCSPAP